MKPGGFCFQWIDCMLDVEAIKVWFPIRRGIFNTVAGYVRAVDGVSLSIKEGETVGLVGESGCGKTTLGRAILGLEKISSGTVRFQNHDLRALRGKQLRTLRRNLQMIFQDPFASLNPRLTVMDLITEGLVEHGLLGQESRKEAAARLMLEVGLEPEGMCRFPHEFSGGQRQRISIARALSLQPKFIVCDEPVSALDVSVQAQVINLLLDLRSRHNLSYLFISHDLSVVRLIAQRIAVMYLGKLVECGSCEQIMTDPQHPYTRTLLSAILLPGVKRSRTQPLQGDLTAAPAPETGCAFRNRCPLALPVCAKVTPPLRSIQGRTVACHALAPSNQEVAG
jgi:oligopeptide/dipeptide ABC transporter ATP-binding protein